MSPFSQLTWALHVCIGLAKDQYAEVGLQRRILPPVFGDQFTMANAGCAGTSEWDIDRA